MPNGSDRPRSHEVSHALIVGSRLLIEQTRRMIDVTTARLSQDTQAPVPR